jgi:hypothetical protein
MPGNPGYLGVCFGSLITANSPASQGAHPVNWQAVLWHEFCHVVTLQMTRNKMPRWLSEGISVYEEHQANPTWGERPANWEAVLWHEFCHVVTLHKTHNKMPRWLSEGISVYEERQADPAWGQSMNPQYREFILNGEATPVSQLSQWRRETRET